MVKMRLVKIDATDVAANEENYNSNFHTEAEALGESIPSEIPQSFKRWLPLIAKSQNIPLKRIQTTILSKTEARLILDASQSSLHTRESNRLYSEELAELALKFEALNFEPEGLFLRLDACSPKDGVRGVSPLKTAKEVVLRLITSYRATKSMLRCIERGDEGVELSFLPFDSRMRTDKEFRVFCAPPNGNISAISQYRWHEPSLFSTRPVDELSQIMEAVMVNARIIHESILEEAKSGQAEEMDRLLLKQGFTFDIMIEEDSGECKLIELNSFGARSGCGSCLFHWLRDWDVLYGRETPEIEFRISV